MTSQKVKMGPGNEEALFNSIDSIGGYKTNGVLYPEQLYANTVLPLFRTSDNVQVSTVDLEVYLQSPNEGSLCVVSSAPDFDVGAVTTVYFDIPQAVYDKVKPRVSTIAHLSINNNGTDVIGSLIVQSVTNRVIIYGGVFAANWNTGGGSVSLIRNCHIMWCL